MIVVQQLHSSFLFPDATSGNALGFRVFNILLASITVMLSSLALWDRRHERMTVYKAFVGSILLYALSTVVGSVLAINQQIKVTPAIYISLLANLNAALWAIMATTLRRDEQAPQLFDHGDRTGAETDDPR